MPPAFHFPEDETPPSDLLEHLNSQQDNSGSPDRVTVRDINDHPPSDLEVKSTGDMVDNYRYPPIAPVTPTVADNMPHLKSGEISYNEFNNDDDDDESWRRDAVRYDILNNLTRDIPIGKYTIGRCGGLLRSNLVASEGWTFLEKGCTRCPRALK